MSNNPIRIIVAGTRTFNDYDLLSKTLDDIISWLEINRFSRDRIEIVCGGAKGADTLGAKYATANHLKIKIFLPDWNTHGKSAGYLRNKEMAKYASYQKGYGALVAFWDGESKGTKWMISLAKEYDLKTYIIEY